MNKDVYSLLKFNLYGAEMGAVKHTKSFNDIVKMIINERAVIMTARHFPKFETYHSYYKPKAYKTFETDYRLCDSYRNAGFTVYRMTANDYNLFSDLYFDFMGGNVDEQ